MDVSGSVATRTRSTKVDSVDIDDENEPILVDDEIEPKKKKQPNKNASLVWDHFSKAEKVGDKMKSTCNYCGTEFTCNSDVNGTSSMRTHLLIRCKVYELSDFNKKKRKREGTQTTLGFEPVGEGGSSTVSKLTAAFERLEEEDNLNVVLGVREDELGVDNANDLELEVDGSSDIMESGKSQGKGRAKQPIVGEVENKVVQMKDGMKKLFNWYEKRSIDEGQAPNAIESSRNKDKMGKRSMDLCEAMDSEFLQHMEEETNMVSKSELERNPPPPPQNIAEEKPKSIYDFTAKDIRGNNVPLGNYKGKVVLLVNVASQCGLTQSNYKELNVLYEKYKDQGFEILAFPCNQFGGQEPGTNEEIQETACTRFKAEFPIFDKIEVNGENAAPLYKFLKSEKGGLLGDDIKWNFTKFLVNKEGKVVERYAPTTSPLKIEKDIQNILGSL
ncbi:hypothetical protein Vadar_020997 [Vaccinium darrowii]|uniref:Uncharacterized protein n=1 Tax=Vaccinium darrowii TaxID=229202 RepID=A0ACB7X2P2_9ERIC|nr:hypothetical protein Vadar_020997 [Vaccinium darrowii]